jgi:hypothetical protein
MPLSPRMKALVAQLYARPGPRARREIWMEIDRIYPDRPKQASGVVRRELERLEAQARIRARQPKLF